MKIRSCVLTGHCPHKFPWKGNEAGPCCAALKTVLMEQNSHCGLHPEQAAVLPHDFDGGTA